ncbi:uncharacterized protein LOC120350399 [Nilaparvata lugens]|uniref:uncharacterized protein LOC120350399 n=1 Tax=Nilaparvata lugens TaxID=108931 RepID=UPI00193CB5BD|nr:uncharacterized protein LOC120350399 [Nilaparvata lugens]
MLCWHHWGHPPSMSTIFQHCCIRPSVCEYKHIEGYTFCCVMSSNERLSLFKIEEILAQDDDILDALITLIPPEDILSEGDSGEEDEVDIDHLSKKQLLSHAEASMRRVTEDGIRTEIISSEQQPAVEAVTSPKLQADPSQNFRAGPSRNPRAGPSVRIHHSQQVKQLVLHRRHRKSIIGSRRISKLFKRNSFNCQGGYKSQMVNQLICLNSFMMMKLYIIFVTSLIFMLFKTVR